MANFADYTILFVPGFLAQVYESLSKQLNGLSTAALIEAAKKVPVIGGELARLIPTIGPPIDPGGGVTFFDQESAFRSRKIDCVNMTDFTDFNTLAGVSDNGASIRGALDCMGDRKVLIVSHSKGGLDTLDALIGATASQRASVHGWLSIQAPFHGSPLADIGGEVASKLGLDLQSLTDLRISEREPYMSEHSGAIAALIGSIPVTCVYSSYKANAGASLAKAALEIVVHAIDPSFLVDVAGIVWKNATGYWYAPHTAFAHDVSDTVSLFSARTNRAVKDVLGNFGVMDLTNAQFGSTPNDGLVPEYSAQLEGADNVRLTPDSDHAGPVMSVTPFRNFLTAAQRIEDTEQRLADLIARAVPTP